MEQGDILSQKLECSTCGFRQGRMTMHNNLHWEDSPDHLPPNFNCAREDPDRYSPSTGLG